MPYLVFDTETTGLPDWQAPADAEHQPRLASIAMLLVDDDFEIEERIYSLIRPVEWEMAAGCEASIVNGLTQERLLAEGRPIEEILDAMDVAIMAGRTLVAHNLQFDSKIMRGELRRAGYTVDCQHGICTMRRLRDVCAIPAPRGNGFKFPRLGEACNALLKRPLLGAHNALADAKACLWLLRWMGAHDMVTAPEKLLAGVT